MNNMIKVLVDDVNSRSVYETEVDGNSASALSKIIKCECIDVGYHLIDKEEYTFIVDDEGLLIQKPVPSVVKNFASINVGTTIICKSEGSYFASLSDKDIAKIRKHIKFLREDCDNPDKTFPTVFVD
ncbi:DUF3846 domain-containing protein [Lactobacillus acetotolerans]|uniref:DUF3846 domain-containing protein n=1 Tax=Lactobacillus acetotolerans TaxID=1600 RepID=A0A5P5ZHF6_9LACO|nr:hypothetical protein [Lactobacillus acetotolerans]KRN39500.1 hypothetical protein FC77_GL001040 [Lactobacillus acetotolerans DSM 20749 = JCM 3825]QFG50750.1 hypothetical protein LA749_01335 [Lactobacillus acetotolerans]GGV16961.1 hypothetical protein GCM10011628_12910 [Lactobacillus acetotolerans DSM 20749 = JCM 3825]